MKDTLELAKRSVGYAAADRVQSGMRLGLGTGSTFKYVLERLAQRQFEGLVFAGVPSSDATAALAREMGIELLDLDSTPELDLTIDGADEVGPGLALIKGGGSALTREKIVASASRQMLVIVHRAKVVDTLGAFPLPVEVLAFGWRQTAARLADLGCRPEMRRQQNGEPLVTDSGNYILDCPFGSIADPAALATSIDRITGVVEHGLFIGMASVALVAESDGSISELTPHR